MTAPSQQQPWPSTVQRAETGPLVPQPRHGRPTGTAPGYGSASAPAAPQDSSGMTALRIITYALTSLASLLFIALVVYGAIKLNQLQDAFANSPFGNLSTSSSSPDAGTRPAICDTEPTNAICYGG